MSDSVLACDLPTHQQVVAQAHALQSVSGRRKRYTVGGIASGTLPVHVHHPSRVDRPRSVDPTWTLPSVTQRPVHDDYSRQTTEPYGAQLSTIANDLAGIICPARNGRYRIDRSTDEFEQNRVRGR
jgi:hypothetical protein